MGTPQRVRARPAPPPLDRTYVLGILRTPVQSAGGSISHTRSGRRKDGQPRNTNRLRHGVYSRQLTPSSDAVDPRFELALARKRLLLLLEQQQSASPRDWIRHERDILRCLQLIISLKDYSAAYALSDMEEAFPSPRSPGA